jgi:5-methylthioadenosine/S-adenosylhomocysteine deaminase
MMPERIKISAAMIVAFQEGEHRILEDGCLVLEGSEIVHVGKDYEGRIDQEIEANDRVITPGFINVHTHLTESPLDKSLVEDVGKRQFSLSGLADMLPARGQAIDAAGRRACVDY